MPSDRAMFRAVVLAGCSLVGCGDEAVELPREEPVIEEPVVEEPVVEEPVAEEPVVEEPVVEEPVAETEPEDEPEPEAEPEPPRMRPSMERMAEAPCPPGSELDVPPCVLIL